MTQQQIKQAAAELIEARRRLESAQRNYQSLASIVSWIDSDTMNVVFGTYEQYRSEHNFS